MRLLHSKSLANCAAYCKSSRVFVLAIVLSLDGKRGQTTVDRRLIALFDLSSRRILLLIFARGTLVVCRQPWHVCEGRRPLLNCCALNSVSERVVGERFQA